MEKKSFFENISEIKDNLLLYLEAKLSLYILLAFQKLAKALTVFVTISAAILFFSLAILFFSGAGVLYLGKLLESYELGLLIVGGFYLFLGFVFFFFKPRIFNRIIIRYLVTVFFKDDDDEKTPKS
ncbi:MAG: hypothetical protein EA361_16690 [Bacteroidetes bacterium]|nr:MAG: hypothetical protein EA361_16690 [Bacteroidota bacterium]